MKVETKYCEIADHLKEEIRTGKYPPGSVFPSLKMICRRFGVSYLTAVKALESLKDLGLVKSQNGVGTFVARRMATIGLVMPMLKQVEVYPPICQEFSRLCLEKGVSIDFADISALRSGRVRPVVVAAARRMVADGVAGVDVILDGGDELATFVEEPCDWTDESLVIEGDGPHEVTFLFWNTGTAPGDHAVLDHVAWSGAAATAATQATPAPVPFSWLSSYGLASDGNYGGAAFAPAANPAYDVWQCWLAGISPVDPDAQFRAAIRMVDGEPVVTPDPDLGSERDYTVVGKASLEEYDWLPAGAASRFFRVKVSMPQ